LVIDTNIYWFPEEVFSDGTLLGQFLSEVPVGYGTVGKLEQAGDRRKIVIERPAGCPGVDYVEGEYRLESILRALDGAGVDGAVMKVPCCNEWMSLDMCRVFNDGMADYARRSGGRLTALAVVPPWGSREQLDELDRCRNTLGMNGVQLSAHYGNLYLDDPAFRPLFEFLNESGMTAYVHHTPVPVDYPSFVTYNNLRRSYGRCADQAIAVSRELFSGLFEAFPNLRIVHSMLGGGYFAFLNMMLPPKAKTPDTAKRFDETTWQMRKYLERNLFFEMSHAQPWGKDALECAVKVLGAGHIVYGSSYPVRAEWLTGGPDFVRSLSVSEEEKELILHQNAERLYGVTSVKEIL